MTNDTEWPDPDTGTCKNCGQPIKYSSNEERDSTWIHPASQAWSLREKARCSLYADPA